MKLEVRQIPDLSECKFLLMGKVCVMLIKAIVIVAMGNHNVELVNDKCHEDHLNEDWDYSSDKSFVFMPVSIEIQFDVVAKHVLFAYSFKKFHLSK